MSKRRKTKYVPRFIMLEHLLMDSAAFRALSGDAVKLLLLVWKRHDATNNGEISCSVREAADLLQCRPNTAGERFKELVRLGFLAVEMKGAFSVKVKRATTWRLTFEPCRGQPATREYARWTAPAPASSSSPSTSPATAPAADPKIVQLRAH